MPAEAPCSADQQFSPLQKKTNGKVPPLIMGLGVLSPHGLEDSAKEVGSTVPDAAKDALKGSGSDDSAKEFLDSSRIRMLSFGQSRCSSQARPSAEMMMQNVPLSGHQGIMTFGNFASLLEDEKKNNCNK